MDYHSLSRKELQSLCKTHKIPANLTNSAMADALSALNLVDEVQNTGKSKPKSPVASRKPTARKPQSDLIDNEPKIQGGLARSRRAPLHRNSSTSEETIKPKTSAPRTCQEKSAREVVSKAKESNNGKEMEVPVITRRSTRVQQKSKLKITEPAVLSVEVNVDQMKSESELSNDVQQKLDGANGNSSEEEHGDVVSGNVDGVEKTGKFMLDIPLTRRKSIVRKPQPELIDNEPRIRVGLARPRRVTFLENSSATEEAIIPKTAAPQICQEKAAREVVSKAKESNNGKEPEVPVITRRSTRVQQKSKLKIIETVLKVGETNKVDMLSEEVNVEKMKSESVVADDVHQKREGTNGNSSKEEHGDLISRNVSKSIARKPQPELIDNEPRIRVGLARPRRVTFLENSSATKEAIIPKTSAPRTCQEKAARELVSKAKESNNGKETEVPDITRRSTRTRVLQKSILKRTEPVLKVGGTNEAVLLPVEVNVHQMKSEFEVANDVPQKLDGTNGNSSKEEHGDTVIENEDSFYVVEITENLEDSEVYEVACELERETEIHDADISELKELSMDSDCFYFEAMKDLMAEVLNSQETKNCTFEIQQEDDCDKLQCVNVAADVDISDAKVDGLCDEETSYEEENNSVVEFVISDAAEENEKDNSCVAADENEESADANEMTENLEESEVHEVASKLECETEMYAVNVSALEELSMDCDCFYFEAMRDLMEEVMNNQEAENCTFEIQQEEDRDKFQCVNVATDFDTTALCNAEVDLLADEETSYDKENNSDVELVISDYVEENQKDNSGDTVDKNEDNSDADEILEVVADLTVPLATPSKMSTSANQVQEIPRMSSTKKKVTTTTSRSFIKVLDDNKEIDGIRSTSKVGTKVILEENENKHEITAQRKLKATSLGQLRKMMKQLKPLRKMAKPLNPADTINTVLKLHKEKRPALQLLSNNSLVDEKEN